MNKIKINLKNDKNECLKENKDILYLDFPGNGCLDCCFSDLNDYNPKRGKLSWT